MAELLLAVGNIIGLVLGFIINYKKQNRNTQFSLEKLRSETKNENKKTNEKIKDLSIKVDSVVSSVEELRTDNDQLKEHYSFENQVYNRLTTIPHNIIKNNPRLSEEVKQIIRYTSSKIRAFALEHVDSPFRNKKEELKLHLLNEANGIKDSIKFLALQLIPETKKYSGKLMDYDTFSYEKGTLDPIINTMLFTLEKNGLNNDEYLDLFCRFLQDIIIEQLNIYYKWKELSS